MNANTPALRGSIGTSTAALRKALLPILFFEILYRAATSLIIKPLMSLVLQLMLGFSGEDLAFNADIWQFALTLPGILAILLLAVIATLSVCFEFGVVITLARQALTRQPIDMKAAVIGGLWAFSNLRSFGALPFALYCLVLLPLTNMGVASSLLPQLSIPAFITGELTKTPLGGWLLLAAVVVVALVALGLLFTLPAMVLEHCRFGTAARRSLGAVRVWGVRMLGVLLVFALAWLVLFLLPREAFQFFFDSPSVNLWEALSYYGVSLRTPVMVLIWLVATLAQLVLMPLLMIFLVTCYLPLAKPAEISPETEQRIRTWLDRLTGWLQKAFLAIARFLHRIYDRLMARPFIYKHRKLLAVLLVLLVVWAAVGAFYTATGIHDPVVIGHRGSSGGVENTLEAIQGAIDAGADCAEVDILLSADGVPMVIHDSNLNRLSGQNLNVYDLTAEELKAIPLSQNGYTGRISTLAEVVAYCDGKIRLAVEYKLHGHEQADVVERVMAVIGESDAQKESIFLSLDYALVSQMRERYPAYRTGYCVYGNLGQLTTDSLREMDIAFLLVEEWMVSKELVRACRRAWLPVYVWTVNNPQNMEDYLKDGVSGLVTDHPDAAMEILSTLYDLDNMEKPYGASTMVIE